MIARDDCWMCSGEGWVNAMTVRGEKRRAHCVACVRSHYGAELVEMQQERDLMRADRDALAAVLAESADLLDALDKHTHPAIELDTLSATMRKPSTKALRRRDARMRARGVRQQAEENEHE